jgi:hypothetical protein
MANERTSIDVATERILIKVVQAAIRDDEDDFEAQLEVFVTKDSLLAADARCTDLAALIMFQQNGGPLRPESVLELAENTATFAAWSCISAAEFAAYIDAILNATPNPTVLEVGPALRAPFILLANLLMNFQEPTETWHDYLDRVWDALEDGAQAAPRATPDN